MFKGGERLYGTDGYRREFLRRGAEWLKALDPTVDRRAKGVESTVEEEDLRVWNGV